MLPSDVSGRIRTFLLATLVLGLLGMGAELLLIGHFETMQQRIPLFMLGLSVATVGWHAVTPKRATVRTLQAVMTLCVLSGVLGVGLHYQGNEEFELEMYPGMQGVELVQKVLTGATPVMAPGSMALLGLIGLTHSYRHPCIRGDADTPPSQKGDA